MAASTKMMSTPGARGWLGLVVVTCALGWAHRIPFAHAGQERLLVEVTAERFAFTPSEIAVPRGTVLELHLRSDDTAHGFHVRGTDIDVVLPKRGRGEVVVEVSADQVGELEFECSKMCGAGHHFMRGVIKVTE